MNKSQELLDLAEETNEAVRDEIGKFWVVTTASRNSELIDIMWETSVPGMMLQGAGGLDVKDVVLITKDKNKAEKEAAIQLDKRVRG